jgi:hypothetical protein
MKNVWESVIMTAIGMYSVSVATAIYSGQSIPAALLNRGGLVSIVTCLIMGVVFSLSIKISQSNKDD